MARIRTIKPEFFTSETVSALPFRARLTFVGLWTACDDAGRFRADPRLVKGSVWPVDDDVTPADVGEDLTALAAAGLVRFYVADGKRYLFVTNWSEHQYIQHKGAARYPEPPENPHVSGASTEISTDPHEGVMRTHEGAAKAHEDYLQDLGTGPRNLDLGSGSRNGNARGGAGVVVPGVQRGATLPRSSSEIQPFQDLARQPAYPQSFPRRSRAAPRESTTDQRVAAALAFIPEEER